MHKVYCTAPLTFLRDNLFISFVINLVSFMYLIGAWGTNQSTGGKYIYRDCTTMVKCLEKNTCMYMYFIRMKTYRDQPVQVSVHCNCIVNKKIVKTHSHLFAFILTLKMDNCCDHICTKMTSCRQRESFLRM